MCIRDRCTCYHAKVVGDDLEQAVELLSDLVFHSTLDPVELEKEKGVVLEEINMVEDSPEDLVHELLSAAYFQGHTLAPVSYTHLDVYKRQGCGTGGRLSGPSIPLAENTGRDLWPGDGLYLG